MNHHVNSDGLMKMPREQTKNFLNGCVTIVLNLLQPSLDARERLDSTDIVDDDHTMSAAVEPAAKNSKVSHGTRHYSHTLKC